MQNHSAKFLKTRVDHYIAATRDAENEIRRIRRAIVVLRNAIAEDTTRPRDDRARLATRLNEVLTPAYHYALTQQPRPPKDAR